MSNQGQPALKCKYKIGRDWERGLTGSQQQELPKSAESSGAEVSIQAASPDFSGTFPPVTAEFEDLGVSQHDFDDMISACGYRMLNSRCDLNSVVLMPVFLIIGGRRSEPSFV